MHNMYSSLDITKRTAQMYTIQSYALDNLHARKYLIIDLEATGLDYMNEEITEIAVLPIEQQVSHHAELRSHRIKINGKIPENIQKITGITNEDVAKGDNLKDVLGEFVEAYKDYVWVAQCGFEFDFPFLDKEYRRLFNAPLPVTVLDTKILYLNLYPDTQDTISTNFLAEKYGIDRAQYIRHSAAGDVRLLNDIFLGVLKDYTAHGKEAIRIDEPIEVKKFVI